MLIVVPIVTAALLSLLLLGKPATGSEEQTDWRDAFLKAFVLWAALVALLTELLGAFSLIRRPWLGLAWMLVLLVLLAWGRRSGWLARGWRRAPAFRPPPGRSARALLIGLAAVAVLLLTVALAAPPNNVDSLHYHMSRVVHWAQSGSLRHYAASYHPQLLYPPWAEEAILNLRVLWGNDRPANLVQWSSMVVSIVAVSSIARRLGAGTRGQLAAAAFAISIPMGVVQSTSTQNDYAVAAWSAILAYFVVSGWGAGRADKDAGYVALASGLGVLTKASFVVYAAPLLVAYEYVSWRRDGLIGAGRRLLLVAGVVSLLNAGVWIRNARTYGGIYGTSEAIGGQIAFLGAVRSSLAKSSSQADGQNLIDAAGAFGRWSLGRLGHAVGLNLVTPVRVVNELMWAQLARLPAVFGQNTLDALENAAWNHEDTAGNPVHLAAVPITFGILLVDNNRRRRVRLIAYGVLSVAVFMLVPLTLQLASLPFGIRFQLPFFVLWAPVFGAALSGVRPGWVTTAAAGAFVVGALPYALVNNTRPVIGMKPWPTRVDSVFAAPASELAFAADPGAREPFTSAAGRIRAEGCEKVGLRIDSGDFEYLLWWLLDAPQSGIRIESVDPLPSLAALVDHDFDPCAIICTVCGEGRTSLHGLPLVESFPGVRLYLGDRFEREGSLIQQ